MYIPEHFREIRTHEISRIMESYPLATWVVMTKDGLVANHIPFLTDFGDDDHLTLIGHVARSNPLLSDVNSGHDALVIYQAQDSYISPNWYPSKAIAHQQVPTWNYQAVHCHGKIEWVDDVKFVRGVVGRLTKLHEHRIGEETPWKMADAPLNYINDMLGKIVGVRIAVTRILAKSKLSQNKDTLDFQSVAHKIKGMGAGFMAQSMGSLSKTKE